MKRGRGWVAFGLAAWAVLSPPALAESLWSANSDNLYVPVRAHRVGDLLTLIILEKTEASQGAKTTSGRNATISAGPGVGALSAIPQLKVGNNDQLTSGGTTTRNGSLTAHMTVRVVAVLPNGDLQIEGSEEMKLNNEVETITISGECRPEDVSAENTIESTEVADAKITYSGTGSIGDQHAGLLTRFLSWLF